MGRLRYLTLLGVTRLNFILLIYQNQKPHPEGWGMRGMRQDVRPDFLDFRNRLVVVAQTPLICVIETPFSVFPEIH